MRKHRDPSRLRAHARASHSTNEHPAVTAGSTRSIRGLQILIIAIASFVLTQIAIFATSIYLHRALAHRSLSLQPVVEFAFPRRAVAADRTEPAAVGGRPPQAPHLHRQRRRSAQSAAARLLEGAALQRLLLHAGSPQSADRGDLRARSCARLAGAARVLLRLDRAGPRHRAGCLAIGWWRASWPCSATPSCSSSWPRR